MTNSYSAKINETFQLLQNYKSFKISENVVNRNFTIFIGLPGSGKSTLVQLVRGNRNLTAVSSENHEISIVDGSAATVVSKTFLPKLFVEPNSVLVDCPAFGGTHATSHDIAATFLTQKALASAAKIKIVLTCPHYAVRRGVDRTGLTDLLNHVVKFLKPIDKYAVSIGLVVTKVENLFSYDDDDNLRYDSDEVEIQRIGGFLKNIQTELQNSGSTQAHDGQLKLLDVLTQVQDGDFNKIAIFRRPRRVGPLLDTELFNTQKKNIEKLLNDELAYTDVSIDDFGLTISNASKLDTYSMISTLFTDIETIMKDLLSDVKEYCFQLLKQQPQSHEWQSMIMGFKQLLLNLEDPDENLLSELPVYTVKWLQDVGIKDKDQAILKLVENVSRAKIIGQLIEGSMHLDLQDFRWILRTALKQINARMLSEIKEHGEINYEKMIEAIDQHYDSKIKQSGDYKSVLYDLRSALVALQQRTDSDSYDEKAAGVTSWLVANKIFIPGKILTTHLRLQDYYRASDGMVPIEKQARLSRLTDPLVRHLEDMILWQSFLGAAFQELIKEMKAGGTIDNVRMKNWEVLKQKLSKNSKFSSFPFENKPVLSKREQWQLNELVEIALNTQLMEVFYPDRNTLEIRGSVVRLSDVAQKLKTGFTNIHIFALHTIIMDASIDFDESINGVGTMAPIWHFNKIKLNVTRGRLFAGGERIENLNDLTFDMKSDYDPSYTYECLTNYIGFALHRHHDQFTWPTTRSFYLNFLNKVYEVGLSDLLQELKHIDSAISSSKYRQNVDWSSIYESFLKKLDFIHTEKDTTAFKLLKLAAFAKLQKLTVTYDDDLIIDVKEFLENLLKKLDINDAIDSEIGHIEAFTRIKDLQWDFKNALADKIIESEDFTQVHMFQELKTLELEIDADVQELIDEVDTQTNRLNQHKRNLIKQKADLEHKLRKEKTLGILKMVSTALGFFGPIGAAVGTCVNIIGSKIVRGKRSADVGNSINLLAEKWNLVKAENAEKRERTKAEVLQKLAEIKMNISESSIATHIGNFQANISNQDLTNQELISRLKNLKSQITREEIKKQIDNIIKYVPLGKEIVRALQTLTADGKQLVQQTKDNPPTTVDQHIGQVASYVKFGGDVLESIQLITAQIGTEGADRFNDHLAKATPVINFGVEALDSAQQLAKSGQAVFGNKHVDDFDKATNIVKFSADILDTLHGLASTGSNMLHSSNSAKAVKFGEKLEKVAKYTQIGGNILGTTSNIMSAGQKSPGTGNRAPTGSEPDVPTKADSQPPEDAQGSIADKVSHALTIGENIVGQIEHVARVGKDEMAQIDAAIARVGSQILQLEAYEQQIHDTLMPLLDHMMLDMTNVARSLQGKSSITLDVQKWNVQSTLKTVKLLISQFTKEFEVSPRIVLHVDILNDLMSTIIKVYDRIQEYQYQIQLSKYMGDIQLVQFANVDATNNASLQVEKALIGSLIHGQYQRAENAFSQWLLPFGPRYIQQVDNVVMLNGGQFDLKKYKKGIVAMKDLIDSDKTSVLQHDKHIKRGVFGSRLIDPFYVWTSDNDAVNIQNLLRGRKVLLKAAITPNTFNVVKFKTIELQLKVDDPAIQMLLDEALVHYSVSLVHQGTSLYKCDDTVYSVYNGEVSLAHSFEKTTDGSFVMDNKVVNKLRAGNAVLSPYAMWEMEIKAKDNHIGTLDRFENLVRLELVGKGLFIDSNVVCDENLANYYQVDEVETELYRLAAADNENTQTLHPERRSVGEEARSSGHRPTSFINDMLQWTFRSAGNLLTNWTPKPQAFVSVNFNQPRILNSETMSSRMPRISGAETIFLIDTIVRKLTKVKPMRKLGENDEGLSAQVLALNEMDAIGEVSSYELYQNVLSEFRK